MHAVMLLTAVLLPVLVSACEYQNQPYEHGDEWIVNDVFIMNCTHEADGRWRSVIVGCITPNEKQQMRIGEFRRENGYKFSCEQNPQNKTVRLVPEVDREAKCEGGREPGTTWTDGNFQFECLPGGFRRALGCFMSNNVSIPLNGTRVVDNVEYKCTRHSNGSVTVSTKQVGRLECQDQEGKRHPFGSSWVIGNFQWECREGGRRTVNACVPKPGVTVPLGEKRTHYGREYHCKKFDNGTISIRETIDMENQPNCVDQDGYAHAFGTSWMEGAQFNRTCLEGGRVIVANCVTPNRQRVPVNGFKSENGVRYSCIRRRDGTMFFKAEGANAN